VAYYQASRLHTTQYKVHSHSHSADKLHLSQRSDEILKHCLREISFTDSALYGGILMWPQNWRKKFQPFHSHKLNLHRLLQQKVMAIMTFIKGNSIFHINASEQLSHETVHSKFKMVALSLNSSLTQIFDDEQKWLCLLQFIFPWRCTVFPDDSMSIPGLWLLATQLQLHCTDRYTWVTEHSQWQ